MRLTVNRNRDARDDAGFTLIELLVVVVIIGVLVAIAVPVYLNYRKGAANKSAASDVRGAITVVEQYYTENGNTYPGPLTGSAPSMSFATGFTVSISPGNQLQYASFTTGTNAGYKICGMNTEAGTIYSYNSVVGGGV